MTKVKLHCWKCAEPLVDILLPFSRLARCKACKADLHVCRMCEFFDTTVSHHCREPIAEKVNDKTRANFCGYFQPCENARRNEHTRAKSSQASLESLFGLEQGDSKLSADNADKALQELDTLFGLDEKKQE